jgi:hypothetical protein
MKIEIAKIELTLTPTRVADLVGVTQSAIHKRLGTIPGVYKSGGWQIPRESLALAPLFNIAKRNGIEVVE